MMGNLSQINWINLHPVAQETPSFTAGRDSVDSEAVHVLAAPFEVAILEYP
jgi:hypothetical protein